MSNAKNVRMCCVCHARSPKEQLIRLKISSSGQLVDADQKLDGRGIYVHRSAECVAALRKRKAFRQTFGEDIIDEIERLI